MKLRSLFCKTAVIVLFSPILALAQQGGMEQPLTLEVAVKEALTTNPGLSATQAQAKAMAAMPSQAGALPDPMVSLDLLNIPTDTYAFDQEGMTQVRLGVSQMFPFPGKLELKEKAATHEAQAATQQVDEIRLQLTRDVKNTWWRLFYLDHALEIIDQNKKLLRQFVDIAQIKYKVGKGLQQDVLLAQLELSKLEDQKIGVRNLRRVAESRLNALLNKPTDRPIRIPADVTLDLPRLLPEAELLRAAEQARPALMLSQRRIDAARARLDLAHKDYYPDFKLGVAYGRREDAPNGTQRADFASVMFSMSVPLYTGRKQDKAVDQRRSEWMQRKLTYDDVRNKVSNAISSSWSAYRQSSEQFELFRTGIVPQARQTVSSMLAGYQVNKVDFLNLVRSQITLYNYEMRYWRSLAEANQALAKLAAAVGKEKIYE